MKTSIFSGVLLVTLLLLSGCMKDTPDCTIPTITIVPSSSGCKDTCTVVFQIKEKLADLNKTTFRWNFNDSRIPESELPSPKVFFPGPGEYTIDLIITHPTLYCKALTTSMKFVVDNGDPVARFAMNPATGICTLGTCAGTCSISFSNQSLNADQVSWTFRGENGRGESVSSNANNLVLPARFNQPDTIIVTLTASKGGKTSTKSETVIIRPETYVSKILDISGNSEPEEPFLIAENGGTIFIGLKVGPKIIVSQVEKNSHTGTPQFKDFSSNFSNFIPNTSAIKSNSTANLYYFTATAMAKTGNSYIFGAKISFTAAVGIDLKSDTIGPPGTQSEGKCVVEKSNPNKDVLFAGLKRNAGSIEEILLTSTMSLPGFNLVYPRKTISGADIYYILQDGTNYWANLKQRNTVSSLENSIVKLDAGLNIVSSPVFLGANSFIVKRMIKTGTSILLIGNESGVAKIYSFDISGNKATAIFSGNNWVFNDAILITNEMLLCVGANANNGKNRAASMVFDMRTKTPSPKINFYDTPFIGASYSQITHVNSFANTACGLLLTGYVKDGSSPQGSFFAKADRNGEL